MKPLSHAQAASCAQQAAELQAAGRHAEALPLYKKASIALASVPELHNNWGVAFLKTGQPRDAILCFRKALAQRPSYPEAINNLGSATLALEGAAKAAPFFEKALSLDPTYANAWFNLGCAAMDLRDLASAQQSLDQAIRLDPTKPEYWVNRGELFLESGQSAPAETCYQKALALNPSHVLARWDLAILHLLHGAYPEAWQGYEIRWELGRFARRHSAIPLWQGEKGNGGHLLLWCEQGLGDTIFFSRWTAHAAEIWGGPVILEVQPPLDTFLASCPGASSVLRQGQPLPPCQAQLPLPSLGSVLHIDSPSTPLPPFLPSVRLHRSSSPLSAPRVGLVWAGNPAHARDTIRSCGLRQLLPLRDKFDACWVSLQLGAPASEITTLGWEMAQPLQEGDSFQTTASILADLDLLVCVDTAIAHAAGAIGLPTCILLPFTPDWRWGLTSDQSLWFPQTTLARQTSPDHWPSAITRAASFLSAHSVPSP